MKTFCIMATSSAIGALLVNGAPVLAEFRFEPTLSVEERFSDNVDQDPDGQRTHAFITDVTPAADLRWTGSRVTTTLDLSVTARHQTAGEDEGEDVLPDVAGLANAELVREHLFLDASAAASTELLNTREQDTESNKSIVQTYSASPSLVGSFGDFADAETFYRFTQVIETGGSSSGGGQGGGEDLDDEQTHQVGAALTSGTDFSQIRWTLSGEASESDRKAENDVGTEGDVSRRDVALDLEYIIDRSFSLLGGVGYQQFDDGDIENDIDGMTWNTGFRWRPGTRTELTATYGKRDNANSFAGDLRHELGPRTSIFASYSEVLETGQERLADDLSAIGTDPDTGDLIDTRTGQPFETSTSTTTISNRTQRTRRFSTGVNGVRGRNTFGVNGSVEFSEEEGTGATEEEEGYQVGANWGRQLSPRAQLDVDANYARNDFKRENRTDNEYSGGISYTYNIFRNINVFTSYQLIVQTSDLESEEFYENLASLGLRMSF